MRCDAMRCDAKRVDEDATNFYSWLWRKSQGIDCTSPSNQRDRGFHETKDGRNTERTRLKKKGNAEKFEQSGFTYEYDHLQRRRLPTIVLSGHL